MIEGVRELQQATADGWDTLAVLRYRSRRDMLAPIAEAPVGTSRRSLGDWYALSPAAGPNRGRGALAAVTGAMLAAVLWLAAGAVVAWELGVGPLAATGIAAAAAMLTLAVTNVSHGRIAARLDAQSPA